jgi:hypothetical protein
MAYGLKRAAALAAAFDATLEPPKDHEYTVRGSFAGRRFAVRVDASHGDLLVRLRGTNRKGLLCMRRDRNTRWGARGVEETGRRDGQRELKEFIGPHVYVEE